MSDAGTTATSRTRLLILDDDPMIGATIKRIAEFDGHDVVYCEHASDFFEQIDNAPPHIIALDLIMPEMNGIEVMEQLVRRGCRAGLIVSSGVGDRVLDAARRSARDNGLNVIGVLPKPFSASTLRGMLQRAGQVVRSTHTAENGVAVRTLNPTPTVAELRAAIDANEICVAYQPNGVVGLLLQPQHLVVTSHSHGSLALPSQTRWQRLVRATDGIRGRGWPRCGG